MVACFLTSATAFGVDFHLATAEFWWYRRSLKVAGKWFANAASFVTWDVGFRVYLVS